MKAKRPRKGPGVLVALIAIFAVSALLRSGAVGYALATETSAPPAANAEPMADTLIMRIQERMVELDARERALELRERDVQLATQAVEEKLLSMERAERRLKATISQVDGAAETDLEQLTRMYQAMKPKIAAPLFEKMDDKFAAGFLARMTPDAAAAILSQLPSDKGYAISVVLAGRNFDASTQKN